MKVYILGDSRGLGRELKKLFVKDSHEVFGFSRKDGFDFVKDYLKITTSIQDESLVIINAYASGSQLQILKELIDRKINIVVIGSVACKFFDPNLPEYSKNKKDLDDYFSKTAINRTNSNLLLLNISGKVYEDSTLVYDSIKFWLLNTDIMSIFYRAE